MANHAQQGAGKDDGKSPASGKGVRQGTVAGGKARNSDNFANDPERATAAGRKGGHSSGGGR